MTPGLDSWHWRCKSCGFEAANFEPAINQAAKHLLVDEFGREKGLRTLRDQNFNELLDLIISNLPQGRHNLLDVGAAHGWFVKIAAKHFDALGIEPDHAVWLKASAQGIALREGYFPNVLSKNENFDVIVFNDVLEHIPDVGATLNSCFSHLKDNGLIVLNLPCSAGFFYKTSRILKLLGYSGAFERMWQKGLPSPHLHYFNVTNLVKLVEQHGFEKVSVADLPSIRLEGLYDRMSHVGTAGMVRNSLMFVAVSLCLPLIKLFDSDIAVVIARKKQITR